MPVGSLQRDITLIFAPIVFIIINFCFLRSCYAAVEGARVYYAANILSCLIFAFINIGAYKFLSADLHTWLFVITRFGRYVYIGINSLKAVFIFYCIVGVSVFLAPIGLGWIKREKEEKIREKADVYEINRLGENYDNTEVAVNE